MFIEQAQIIEEWLNEKLSFESSWMLSESFIVEHKFIGRLGHPSSYAFVKFECEPSENLKFQSKVKWENFIPLHLVEIHETCIRSAIVDSLLCYSTTPYFGCSLNLIEIKYDEISSSPNAFYKATKEAMTNLIRSNRWDLLTLGKT